MFRNRFLPALTAVVAAGFFSGSYALFGLGAHYIMDFSVKMNAADEQLTFDDLNLLTAGFRGSVPPGWSGQTLGPQDIPVYFTRGEMMRTPFGLGGKIYVDIIPFIDCIELSGGFTGFQYDGKIKYPTDITVNAGAPSTPEDFLSLIEREFVSVVYDSISTNVEDHAGRIPGISKTPYAKLDMGLTVRKYIKIPVIKKLLRPYGGLGMEVMFATPVPSAGLVKDAVGDALSGDITLDELVGVMRNPEVPQKIIDTIVQRLFTPHMGMNLVAGFMLKPPIVPIGLYVDAKYGIPFGKLDENAGVTGMGFKINAGLALHIGKF